MPADEILGLAIELQRTPSQVVTALAKTFADEGTAFRNEWRSNARETSGVHGKHYPNAITTETRLGFGGIVTETGPDSSKKQGGMGRGFELGSQNQPPHLDGARALPAAERRLEKSAAEAVEKLLP